MQRGTPKKKYSKSLEIEKTLLYLIKSNGKRNKPKDKQKTGLKNELKKTVLRKKKNRPQKRETKEFFYWKHFFALWKSKKRPFTLE